MAFWLVGWLGGWVWGVFLLFYSLQTNLPLHWGCPRTCVFVAPFALSRPQHISCEKGLGVVDVICQPWRVGRCPWGHPSSVHSCPEPFRFLESSPSIEGKKWEESGEKVMPPVPGIPHGGVARCKTKLWRQERSARSLLFCSFPQTSLFACAKYQTLHCLPAYSPLHLLLFSEMCLQ